MKVIIALLVCLHGVYGNFLHGTPLQLQKVSVETLSAEPEGRIYGGTDAPERLFSFMVLVLMRTPENGDIYRCSASRVSHSWVLFAAHCLPEGIEAKDLILVGGKHQLRSYLNQRLTTPFDEPIDEGKFGVEERRAVEFHRHPRYVQNDTHDDVALVRLSTPFTEKVTIVHLSSEARKKLYNCVIVGWGLSEGNRATGNLKYAIKDRVNSAWSQNCSYRDDGPFYCLVPGEPGICMGDSGSPLICEGLSWGVASHVIANTQFPSCGDSLEEFYTDVYEYRNWIVSYISGERRAVTVGAEVMIITTLISCIVYYSF